MYIDFPSKTVFVSSAHSWLNLYFAKTKDACGNTGIKLLYDLLIKDLLLTTCLSWILKEYVTIHKLYVYLGGKRRWRVICNIFYFAFYFGKENAADKRHLLLFFVTENTSHTCLQKKQRLGLIINELSMYITSNG